MKKKYISIGQAAALLCVHPDTVRDWGAAQHFPVFRTPGNHRRYFKKDLIKFIEKMKGDK